MAQETQVADLQTALAKTTLTAIQDARFSLAGPIEAARSLQLSQKRQAALTLLTSKPVPQWTAVDHLLFLDAFPDEATPATAVRPTDYKEQPVVGRGPWVPTKPDGEIPF